VPTSPRDLILNGWLSILTSVYDYGELTGSAEARDLFERAPRRWPPAAALRRSGPQEQPLQPDRPAQLASTSAAASGVRVDSLRIEIPQAPSRSPSFRGR
jgi:hypothetical protein